MKKLFVFLILVIASTSLNAQQITIENVPTSVVSAFKAKFSIAEKTTWEMDYDNYVADFSVGKTNFSAKFDKDGKWLETVTYIKSSELPKGIKETLTKKYGELSAYKIEEVKKVEKEKETIYEMDIIKGENTFEVEFANDGEMVKEEKKTENKKD
jgi:hypothetical protein